MNKDVCNVIKNLNLFNLINLNLLKKEHLEFCNDLLGRQGFDFREFIIVQFVRIPFGWFV